MLKPEVDIIINLGMNPRSEFSFSKYLLILELNQLEFHDFGDMKI